MTEQPPKALHALVLAGGRSRRLGGVPKAGLVFEGQTLLARTVDAAARVLAVHRAAAAPDNAAHGPQAGGGMAARAGIAVVGPVDKVTAWLVSATAGRGATFVQEDPPCSGPAPGIAAGLDALEGDGHVLVLACDMPRAGDVAELLLGELRSCAPGEGTMAVAAGKLQPLAAIYPVEQLREAVAAARLERRLENASVFSLVASVNIKECAVPQGLTADIDTWEDARAQGIAAVPANTEG